MDTYEKKYNEALERFKSFKEKYYTKDTNLGDVIFDKTGKMQKDFEDIFPELRESEDERIRRELIEYLRGDLDDITTDDTDRWIAYLEKQKELPFVKDVILGYPGLYFYDGERMHFRGPTMEEKQTEQKELPLMDGNADLYFDEWNQQKQNPTKRQCFEEGMRYAQRLQKEQKPADKEQDSIAFLEQHGYTIVPPHAPVSIVPSSEATLTEWSEEDEKLLDLWLDVIDRNDWRMDEDFCKASREFINRLKSLRQKSKEELAKMLQEEYNKGKEEGERMGYTKGYDKGYKNAEDAYNKAVSYHS